MELRHREKRERARERRRNRGLVFLKSDKMAAEVEGVTLSHTHDQLRRQTVKHRMGTREGLDGPEDVDMGNARDVAIDFMGGVVSGISGIVVGQVRVCAASGNRFWVANVGTVMALCWERIATTLHESGRESFSLFSMSSSLVSYLGRYVCDFVQSSAARRAG